MDSLDIFAGAGGFTLGMKDAGFRTRFGVEIEADRRRTFDRHTPQVWWFGPDAAATDYRWLRGRVEVVYGGPPCQPFSNGGLQHAEADPRNGIPHFVRAVSEIGPRGFLMENVVGLATGKRKEYLDWVTSQLAELGYRVTWAVLDAADYGVPQHRKRLFVVGVATGPGGWGGHFRWPEPSHGPGRHLPHIAVRDVLPVTEPVGEPCKAKVMYLKNPHLRPSCYDGLMFNGQGRPIDVTRPCRTIIASAGGNKTHFFDLQGVVPEYHAHLKAGGEPRTGEVPGCRRLSVEESAVLQGFSQHMRFQGSRSSQYAQVGDAVPPRLAATLGRALMEALGSR